MPVPGPMRMQGTWGSCGRWNPGALHTPETPVRPKDGSNWCLAVSSLAGCSLPHLCPQQAETPPREGRGKKRGEIPQSDILAQKNCTREGPVCSQIQPCFLGTFSALQRGIEGKELVLQGWGESPHLFHPLPCVDHLPSYKTGHYFIGLYPIEPRGADSMVDWSFSV